MTFWLRMFDKNRQAFSPKASARRSTRRHALLDVLPLEDRCVPTATMWTQRGGDSGHTGFVDVDIDPTAIGMVWSQSINYDYTGDWAQHGNRGVAIDDTAVYRVQKENTLPNVGDYHVMAFDLQSGTLLWNQPMGIHGPISAPSVANGLVYINRKGHSGVSGGGPEELPYLYALDPQTGEILLTATYAGQEESDEQPTIDGNQVITWDGYSKGFSSWETTTLFQQWNQQSKADYESPAPAFGGSLLYAYGDKVFSRATGAFLHDIVGPAALPYVKDPMVAPSGRVFFNASDGDHFQNFNNHGIVAYDSGANTPIWYAALPVRMQGKAVGNGMVAVTAGKILYLFDEASGTLLRTWQAPNDLTPEIVLTNTHAFVESGTLYNGNTTVHAVNLQTMQSDWSYLNTLQDTYDFAYMNVSLGGGMLLLSHDSFVKAFKVSNEVGPTAIDDTPTAAEDTPLTINVLANDFDGNGDVLTVTKVSTAAHGSAKLNGDNTITYTPFANYFGSDSFTYTITDGNGGTDTAKVNVTITPGNDPPTASNNQFETEEETSLTNFLQATDIDGDALTYALVSLPTHGAVQLTPATGKFTYTPDAGWIGDDSFTFEANDGKATSNVATISIDVQPGNDAPLAVDDNPTTTEDTPVTINVLGNDSDGDGDTLTVTKVGTPSHGSAQRNGDNTITYTPDANYFGSDSFTYTIDDGHGGTDTATVNVTITSVNDPPSASSAQYGTTEDTSLTKFLQAADVEGDALTYALVNLPTHGAVQLNIATGKFTYTPDVNWNGDDFFTFKASDGKLNSNVATISITVAPGEDAPMAVAGPDQTVNEGTTVFFDGSGSSDPDGDKLTYAWNFGDGATATGPTAAHTYNDSGTFTVTLTVNDGHGNSSTDTLLVTVDNIAPTGGVSGPSTGVRGQVRTFTFTANDLSPVDQAGPFTYEIGWGDGSATQTVQGATNLTRDHVFTSNGTFTVSLTVTDKDGGISTPVTRTITIGVVEMQGTSLAVGGTLGNDIINIKRSGPGNKVTVTINSVKQGVFTSPTDQILVFGQDGADTLKLQTGFVGGVTAYVTAKAILDGGGGNDIIDARGSNAANILLGGDGTDSFWGGSGRDLLLGGLGADILRGVGNQDILFGGTTDFDTNRTALTALIAEWRRTDVNYVTRVNHLNGTLTGGLNGTNFLTAATLHDDAAVDQLYGQLGQDWFPYRATGIADLLKDKANNEQAMPI